MTRTATILCAAAAILAAAPALADHHGATAAASTMRSGEMIHADMLDASGKSIGMAMLQETPNGVLITTDVKGLPAGEHGFHFHEKGLCDSAQKFTTAGSHFTAGKKQHGLLMAGGHHGGDMPNAIVGADGTLKAALINTGVTLASGPKSLFDADGSALVIHAKPDDYKTQPTGDAGDRIACAVVAAPKK
jgi:Cu-Zn family superoxide dismutase